MMILLKSLSICDIIIGERVVARPSLPLLMVEKNTEEIECSVITSSGSC